MTDDPKPDPDETPNPRPRRRPPIIEGEAKEIPPPGSTSNTQSFADRFRARWSAIEWKTPALFGVGSVLAGVAAGLFGAWLFASPAAAPTDLSSLQSEIAKLNARLAAQESAPKPKAAPDIAPLEARSTKLETAIGELRGEIAAIKQLAEARPAGPSAGELEAINRRLAGIEQRIETAAAAPKPEPEPQRALPRAAELVALGVLRDAIAGGGTYARELETVRALLKDRAAELAPLAASAATGLPTVAELAKRFAPLASALARTPEPEGGVVTRLWSNASKMIEVRPVGEPAGNDPGAVVARMETKLARNDLAGALDEAKALPASARDTAKDWFELAERRRAADTIIKNLTNAALTAIAAEQPKP